MKCPYCTEEIKDEAIVCRFCARDLNFFKPFVSRVAALEASVEELRHALDLIGRQPTETGRGSQTKRNTVAIVSIAGTAVTALIAWFCIYLAEKYSSDVAGFLSLASSVPFAIFLSVRGTFERVTTYLLFGLVQGMVSAAAIRLVAQKDVLPWAGLLLTVNGMLFLSVGLFRRHLKSRNVAFVSNSLGGTAGSGWQRVAAITSALAPLLTLIGTIATAILGYLKGPAPGAK